MILSIHLNGAVLVSVHALSLSLLCLPLVLSTVYNSCMAPDKKKMDSNHLFSYALLGF